MKRYRSFLTRCLISVSVGLTLMGSLTACAQKSRGQKAAKPISQAICGTVLIKRGNQMPGPGSPSRKGQPVEREVLIFPVMSMDQVEMGENGFINSTKGIEPVKTVTSDKAGKFCVDLPVGQYSVVVREPKGLYANLFDGQNHIFPVTVEKKKKQTITVEISHGAVF